jgi:hypothetical protein
MFEYLELLMAGFIHEIVIVGAPNYQSSRRVLGRSPRHRFLGFLVIPNPVPFTILIGDSALYRSIRLWNVLPSTANFSFSIGTFRREATWFLTTVDSSNHIHRLHHHHQLYY